MIRGCPCLSTYLRVFPLSMEKYYECAGRSSDSRFILPAAPSQPFGPVASCSFHPGYSGGPVSGLHGVPFSPLLEGNLTRVLITLCIQRLQTILDFRTKCRNSTFSAGCGRIAGGMKSGGDV